MDQRTPMSRSVSAPAVLPAPARGQLAKAAGLIALVSLLAYHNCFTVPFIYDDIPAILDNPTIRHLWPPWVPFSWPPGDTTVGSRPVANFTFAVNYALSGTQVWSYHALNLLIHILGALVLLGIVRRTLIRPVLAERFGQDSMPLAFAIASLWALHPLQTESVTYIVQRVESLMGLFYLLTVYCFIRSVGSPRPLRWQSCAVASCLIGMATKEVMATAPLMVLLYDRTFVAGTFQKAWQQRRGFYLLLAATWLPLAALVSGTGWNRRGSAGFEAGVAPAAYWLTQVEAVTRYIGLSLWPRPLVFEYGPFRPRGLGEIAPYALLSLPLGLATIVALRSRPVLGFVGAWFLVILAPSSVVPVATQTMAEHRMYLPLAAVAAAVALGVYVIAGRRSLGLLGAMALILAFATGMRNEDYRSGLTLWSDTVAKRPDNPNARNNLGLELFRAGRAEEAIAQYEAAIALQPAYPGALSNLGNALDRIGRTPEAIQAYEKAVALEPNFAAAHYNLAKALDRSGRISDAIEQYRETIRIKPDFSDVYVDMGDDLSQSGSVDEAVRQYTAALGHKPDNARAHFGLGNAMVREGQIPEAISNYEEALRDQPALAEASTNLGVVFCRMGRMAEGMQRIEAAIQMQPDYAPAHFARGTALLQTGRKAEAASEYEKVLKLRPNDPGALRMLELIQTSQ
jgi:tetratricopeptide (TPR) repeat protein